MRQQLLKQKQTRPRRHRPRPPAPRPPTQRWPPAPPKRRHPPPPPRWPSRSCPTAPPPAPDSAAATPPATAASAAEPAFLAQWPGDTRLRYTLGGNYRGELHGDARVLWQREGTRYHTAVQLDVGLLLSMSLTSQGQITAAGLQPAVFEEQVRQRRRGVRLDEDVRLNNGERLPRPAGVQDAASQFVELGHRLATGQISAQPGSAITLWLARPGGVDEWTYDVVGEDTLHLPRLGAVRALHFKPRPWPSHAGRFKQRSGSPPRCNTCRCASASPRAPTATWTCWWRPSSSADALDFIATGARCTGARAWNDLENPAPPATRRAAAAHLGRRSTTRRALPTLRSMPPSGLSSICTLLPT